MIKKGGDYPPVIKIKFNANTKFSSLDKEGTCEIHEFKDVKMLKSVFKLNYKIRFLFTFKNGLTPINKVSILLAYMRKQKHRQRIC